MRGKILAFMGDRTEFGQPHPFQLPEINTWTWTEVSFCDNPVGMATFFDEEDNKFKLWERPGGLQSTQKLPRLIYLPSLVAKFCAMDQRTFWEVHSYVNTLINDEIIDEEQGEFLKMWAPGQLSGKHRRPSLAFTAISCRQWIPSLHQVVLRPLEHIPGYRAQKQHAESVGGNDEH
jgi:hypothetical protein